MILNVLNTSLKLPDFLLELLLSLLLILQLGADPVYLVFKLKLLLGPFLLALQLPLFMLPDVLDSNILAEVREDYPPQCSSYPW